MLSIFADTFRIATRTDQPWLSQTFQAHPERGPRLLDRWQWKGRWTHPGNGRV